MYINLGDLSYEGKRRPRKRRKKIRRAAPTKRKIVSDTKRQIRRRIYMLKREILSLRRQLSRTR